MTKYGEGNAKEALEALGLWNPTDGTKPNHRYLKRLADRGLLKRNKKSQRKITYDLNECRELAEKAKQEGISLTVNI